MAWLHSGTDRHPVDTAAEAHYQLVSIHPFVDAPIRNQMLPYGIHRRAPR